MLCKLFFTTTIYLFLSESSMKTPHDMYSILFFYFKAALCRFNYMFTATTLCRIRSLDDLLYEIQESVRGKSSSHNVSIFWLSHHKLFIYLIVLQIVATII